MTETPENRLRRMAMRSMRRGIKEMDIILGRFADRCLGDLSGADLDVYDALLSENDHDLYAWVTGKTPAPEIYENLIEKIAATAQP